jgi:hypothetical protein
MLSDEDKEKIIELRRQNFTYKGIRAETGFALQTISNVIKEDKDKNLKAEEESDLNKNVEDDFLQEDMVSFDSPIDEVRKISDNIQTLIDNGNLQEGDRREWEKRLGDLRDLIRVEVEYKILEVRRDAADIKDIEWQNFINQGYVAIEVAEDLENTVVSQDATIDQLRNVIVQKEAAFVNLQEEMMYLKESHQMAIDDLNGQINEYYWEIQRLVEDNWYKHNIILDYQYYYDLREQELLNRDRNLNHKEIELKEAIYETDKKHKLIEMRGKYLDEQAVESKKRDEDSKINEKKFLDALNERIKSIENREKNVKILEKILLQQSKEADRVRKKIINDQENITNEWEKINKAKDEL